jgi:DNA-binding CsgD family transcriptional regulator
LFSIAGATIHRIVEVAPSGAAASIDAIRNAILSCSDESQVAAQIADPIRRRLGADGATILAFRRDGLEGVILDHSWSVALPRGCHEAYADGYYRRDPMVNGHLAMEFAQSGPRAHLYSTFDVNNLETVATKDDEGYMQNFWRRHQFAHMAGLVITPEDASDYRIVMAFHRYAGRPAFVQSALDNLTDVALPSRAVFHALTLKREMTRLVVLRNALAAALGDCGFAVVDPDGQVFFETEHALSHWTGDPSRRSTVLKKALAAPNAVFYLGESASDDAIQIISRQTPGSQGRRVILSSAVIGDAAAIARCAAYGLSRRETEVAIAVVEGLSNADIAELLAISIRTVENHVRAIFEKIGAENRTRLARLLWSGR